jgi:osmotically-inducible protein OsmY
MIEPLAPTVVPQTPEDRRIRRALSEAIDQDPRLNQAGVNFIVSNSDVSITGVVKTEEDRERINDLAMGIAGVKSVANALRVAP